MARYGMYTFMVNGNPQDMIVVGDNSLWDKLQETPTISESGFITYEGAVEFLIEKVGFSWNVMRFPYYNGYDYPNWLKEVFRTAYPSDLFSDIPVYYNLRQVGLGTLNFENTSNVNRSKFVNSVYETYDGAWSATFSNFYGSNSCGTNFLLFREESFDGGKLKQGSQYYPVDLVVSEDGLITYLAQLRKSSSTETVPDIFTTDDFSPLPGDDPFEPGGSSGPGGGGGDFDNTSVPIDFPPLPSISVVSTGFVTLYSPTLSQLYNLASYMWSDVFDIDGWKKLFADPMDAILGLSIVPVNVPTSGESEVKVGNISTGVALNKAISQYVEVDCGTINVKEYWGAYLDYSPYTKCEIFLPYVGTRPLSIDDVMNKTIHVKYHVDILSGGLTCFVKCGDSVLYSFIGQCSSSIPINSANYTNMLNGVLNIAGSIGSTVATGGMMAPATAATITTTAFNMIKPEIQKSGAMSGAGAMLGMQIPYLVLTRPRQALPTNQNKFSGYPSLITVKLSDLSGYTEIEKIHLENIPATEVELTELEKLLMEGVIF